MGKYLVDLWLDGYDDEAQRAKAEVEFIREQLDITASSVEVKPVLEDLVGTITLNYMGYQISPKYKIGQQVMFNKEKHVVETLDIYPLGPDNFKYRLQGMIGQFPEHMLGEV